METEAKVQWWKVPAAFLITLLIVVLAQFLAQFPQAAADVLGLPAPVGIAAAAIAYIVLAYLGVKVVMEKLFKVPLHHIRLHKPAIKPVSVVIAVALPAAVILTYMMLPGEWTKASMSVSDQVTLVVTAILFQSIAAGIVEEMVFRGVMFGLLEKKIPMAVAAIIPSVLFGAVHYSNGMSLAGFLQLLAAGTLVGVMFSVICYYSENFWNNALVHACWNATTFGVMHIDSKPGDMAIYTYVLHSDSELITGGDFGIEASVISIAAYALVILFFAVLIRRKNKAGTASPAEK
ncbi:MAG: CPBP family intramembrane metalloprotease [Lachnospiraceae bacterium]|nr:CPBP family intramembrane metalloprotease [Lachnospiraceae bacterium]